MVRIVVNNTALDIGNVSISFDLRNPIFNTIGSFSYPFNLPNTPKNRAVLGFPHKLHYAGAVNKSHQADIYIAGLHWKQGVIIVRDANKDQIKVNFGVGEGYFYNLIKELKIRDFDYGGKRYLSDYYNQADNSWFMNVYDKSYPDNDFSLFPVLYFANQDVYEVDCATTEAVSIMGTPVIDGFQTGKNSTILLKDHILPQFNGIYIIDDNLSWIYQTGIYNSLTVKVKSGNVNIGKTFYIVNEASGSLANIFKSDPGATDRFPRNYYYNYWHPTLNKYRYLLGYIVLFPFLMTVFDKIFENINFNLKYNALNKIPQFQQLVLFNNFTISLKRENTYFKPIHFDLKNSIPDVSLQEFFEFLNKIFCLHLFIDDAGNVSFQFFKDIFNSLSVPLNSPFQKLNISPSDFDGYTIDLISDNSDSISQEYYSPLSGYNYKGEVNFYSQLPSPPNVTLFDCYYVRQYKSYYYYDNYETINPGWYFLCIDEDVKIYQGGKKQINIPNLLPHRKLNTVTGEDYEALASAANAFLPSNRSRSTHDALKLMFWHGLHNNKPFGSSLNVTTSNQVIAPYSLEWSGQYGLKENFYKEYLHFLETTRTAEYLMPLTAAQLKQIDFSKKYRWDQADWLIDRITFTVTNNKISPAKITVRKCQQ